MEFDKSTIAVSSEYSIKIVFSVPVQSFVYNVKRTGDKTHPCGTPVEMENSPYNTVDPSKLLSMAEKVYNPND